MSERTQLILGTLVIFAVVFMFGMAARVGVERAKVTRECVKHHTIQECVPSVEEEKTPQK